MKNNKGVTIAVLIITIIVTLILAVVSIRMVKNADRTAKVAEMNKEAIDFADSVEGEAVKEKYNQFSVNQSDQVDDIQICSYEGNYGYIPSSIPRDNGKMIFFKANTENNENIMFFINNELVNNTGIWNYYDQSCQQTESGSSNVIGLNSYDFISQLRQNGELFIEAKFSGGKTYSLEIIYNSDSEKSIAVSSNSNQIRYNDDGVEIISETEYNSYQDLDKHNEEGLNVSKYTTLSKEAEQYGSIVKKTGNSLLIRGKASSVDMGGNPNYGLKLYSVLEKNEDNKTTLYLDDYNLVFYNPVEDIEVSPIVITSELYNFITKVNINIGEDINEMPVWDLANEFGMVVYGLEMAKEFEGATMEQLAAQFEFSFDNSEFNNVVIKFDFNYDAGNANIKSSKIQKDTSKTDTETRKYVKINFEDFNGNILSVPTYFEIKEDIGDVFVADSTGEITNRNFEIYANSNPSSRHYEPTFEKAYMRAMQYGEPVTIEQNISSYRIDEGYGEGNTIVIGDIIENNDGYDEEYNEGNGETAEPYDNENMDNDTSQIDLTIDLRGNTLQFKEDSSLVIGTNANITIKSTENYGTNTEVNGKMQFSFSKEEEREISISDFLSDPKNAYYLSFEKWCKHEGITIEWWKIVTKTEAYKRYLNAVQTAYSEYNSSSREQSVLFARGGTCAITNMGTLNFESGKIEANYNYLTGVSIINNGSETVENTVSATKQFFKNLGINISNGVGNNSNWVAMMNQATGIINLGTLKLGTTTGIQESSQPHPEIAVYNYNKNSAIGTLVGKYDLPNYLINLNVGIIAQEGSTTIINSGFIENGVYNNIKNWWSIVIGNYFVEIANVGGNLEINGLTRKTITENDSLIKPSISKINDNSIFQNKRKGSFVFSRLLSDSKSEGVLSSTKNYLVADDGNSTISPSVEQFMQSNYSINNIVELIGNNVQDSSGIENNYKFYKYSDTIESYIESDWKVNIEDISLNTLKNYNGTVAGKIVSNLNTIKEILNSLF